MINADRTGHVLCARCGHTHHFYGPCLPAPAGGAVLQPPGVAVGCRTAAEARAEADSARTAASKPRTPQGGREWGGS